MLEAILFEGVTDGQIIDWFYYNQEMYEHNYYFTTMMMNAIAYDQQTVIKDIVIPAIYVIVKDEFTEKIFFPLHYTNHWSLLMLNYETMQWSHYDSTKPKSRSTRTSNPSYNQAIILKEKIELMFKKKWAEVGILNKEFHKPKVLQPKSPPQDCDSKSNKRRRKGRNMLEIFNVEPCKDHFQLGFLIGQRFSDLIRSRVATDLILQHQLIPFAHTLQGKHLIDTLCITNQKRFPRYWDELLGTAEGSGIPFLQIILMNFRKEILPFIPENAISDTASEDCSDVIVVNDSVAILGHNEDGNIALVGHTYLVRARLQCGTTFTAYTYAGELPSCAFGFNNHGLAFTLDSVPPTNNEISCNGMGRNFISRDLLEATSLDDALNVKSRVRFSNISVGHSYNLVDVKARRIMNVETASGNRFSFHEAGGIPYFHANMYLHLTVQQEENESSLCRQRRAALLPANSKQDVLNLLGDSSNKEHPIYMTGPKLYTLCTVLIDLDDKTLSIIQGNPMKEKAKLVLPLL